MALPASFSRASAAAAAYLTLLPSGDRFCVLGTRAVYKSRFQKNLVAALVACPTVVALTSPSPYPVVSGCS
jgi:hypothetical protein